MRDGETQKPVGIVSLSRDITERKQAEEALRESEERYKALFDRSLDLVYTMDFEGRFIDANDAALNRLGYTREEISSPQFCLALERRSASAGNQNTTGNSGIRYSKKPG